MKGEMIERKTIGQLFDEYCQADGPGREIALQRILGELVLVIVREPLDGNFQELVEVRQRFPNEFQRVMDLVCRRLNLPTEGLTSLLRLYLATRDGALRENLFSVRQRAVEVSDWATLGKIADAGLTRELAQAARRK